MPCHATPRRYGTVFGVCGTAEAEAEAEVLEADGRLVIDAHGIVLGLTLVPARDGGLQPICPNGMSGQWVLA